MTHAYSESYLNSAKSCLASFFDYAVNDCGMKPGWIASLFVAVGCAEQFERGNPAYVAGLSGVELAREVVLRTYGEKKDFPEPMRTEERSPEYWMGWALASYQWYSARRFRDIFARVPPEEMLGMYAVYHEEDISHFIADAELRYRAAESETNLRRIRKSRGLSQTALSEQAGVNLRSIRMYEQRGNSIDRAQAQTLYRLSRVLGCCVEDLLENPMEAPSEP